MKLELQIDDGKSDAILNSKIDEASADISAALGYKVERETVAETFWGENNERFPEYLLLDRVPVTSIDSVTVDGSVIDASLYRLDANTGLLYALDAAGYPFVWIFCKSVVVAYSGGYILPGQTNRDLPYGIEGGCIDLVQGFWQSRGRDPAIKSEEIPGVMRVDYWVGAIGEEGELPPSVQAKIAPYRRPLV